MIQNSIEPCGLSSEQAPPLCANSCVSDDRVCQGRSSLTINLPKKAEFATSEHILSSNPALCGSRGADALAQIRADFTNCALPANSLAGNCVEAAENEPNDCGYHENLGGLCGFCRQSSLNATDSCCITAGVESRCEGLQLPTFSYDPEVFTIPSSTSTAGPTSTAAASAEQPTQGLTGGQVAGIAVGAVLAALLLLALIIACAMVFRRRKHQTEGSPFNKPAPFRQMQQQQQQPHMGYIENDNALGLAPGGRVARMAALEAESTSSESRGGTAPHIVTASRSYRGSTSDYHDSPRSGVSGRLPKRAGSLSSGSALAATTTEDPTSPRRPVTAEPYSSPDAVTSGQSEQLSFFKDYYSQDEIRPGDAVSTLWAYQPRANDEFELERGDMLKVVGIWDDGWATGTRLGGERAEDWDERKRKREQRDSGVSNGSGKAGTDGGDEGDKSADDGTVEGGGEIKAFPVSLLRSSSSLQPTWSEIGADFSSFLLSFLQLVCVCLPQHWKKTIEGDSVETTATGPQPPTSPVSPASPASGET